jgi:phospholipid/cholesterol/gamma-HCH transport system ATP-binding protein
MIELKQLNLLLNHKSILTDINLIIPDDCRTVIIGKSGCGKTMLVKTIIGLFTPQSGSITIDGEELQQHTHAERPILRKLAMLFQNAALLDSFTVYQNVALPLSEHSGFTAAEINSRVKEVLTFLGLLDTVNSYPAELSGGMRKRVGMARAIIMQPKYLILDEPTTGLDPVTSEDVMAFLKLVIREKQVIPVTITHDPYCINELGDYIILMDSGKVLYSGYKKELETLRNSFYADFYHSFFIVGQSPPAV